MPRTSLPCNQCGELLRIWPSDMGPTFFKCKEEKCWSKGEFVLNNGTNRFNCFACDLDTCRECGKDATMADTKVRKEDPLLLAGTFFQFHRRGSRGSIKVCATFARWSLSRLIILSRKYFVNPFVTTDKNKLRWERLSTTFYISNDYHYHLENPHVD